MKYISKRILDFFIAFYGLLLLSPLIIMLILLIRLSSRGPAIIRQERVGINGFPFTLYKLRSMNINTPHLPTHLIGPDALTPLGRFLRQSKLDELPQLYNVLKGEMSLVGPRPSLPSQIDLIHARKKSGGLKVQPGITGLAQVRGIDMSQSELLAKIDGYYAKTRSFRGDLIILKKTLFGGMFKFNSK